ncbi:MAG: hypothetical protein R2856_14085 [Caldilineaceae bacterium]
MIRDSIWWRPATNCWAGAGAAFHADSAIGAVEPVEGGRSGKAPVDTLTSTPVWKVRRGRNGASALRCAVARFRDLTLADVRMLFQQDGESTDSFAAWWARLPRRNSAQLPQTSIYRSARSITHFFWASFVLFGGS